MSKLKLSQIHRSKHSLREVIRDIDFFELMDSVREKGVILPILVRPCPKNQRTKDGLDIYYLVDGLQRLTASMETGRKNINVSVKDITEEEAWQYQIVANAHKIETKPMQYSKMLKLIVANGKGGSKKELAKKLGKSITWLTDRLNLNDLSDEMQVLVDDGTIPLSNALSLARLPKEEQEAFKERAIQDSVKEFNTLVRKRCSQIKMDKRSGLKIKAESFYPVSHLRKLSCIIEEIEDPRIGPAMIKYYGIKSLEDAFILGLKFTTHLDGDSILIAEQRWNKKQQQKADQAERLKKEHDRLILARKAIKEGSITTNKQTNETN